MQLKLLDLSAAASIIRGGGIVIYPTETFWAIGAKHVNLDAAAAIYKIKERPPAKPLPLIAGHLEQVEEVAAIEGLPSKLITRFWPGPLTLVLPAKACSRYRSFRSNLAIRVTSNAQAATLAIMAEGPLIATSANKSGQAPPKSLQDIGADILGACDACGLSWGILQGSTNPRYESSSTVATPKLMDNRMKLQLLRAGAISRDELLDPEWEII